MKEAPFIKLIPFLDSYYIYDVNKNDVLKISRELYLYLKELSVDPDTECQDGKVREEAERLKENGYLSSNKIKVMKHPASDSLEAYLERKINKVTLQLTQNCNLRCSYCVYSDFYNAAQRVHSGKRMTLEVAKKAVDFLAQHSIDNDKVNIGFYGGEPLMEFQLIKDIVEYAEDILAGKEFSFSITTNATMLTPEIVAYFVAHDVQLMVSLDGPKDIHDINRRFAADGKGSFDTVIRNLKQIQKEYPEYIKNLSISMVTDPQNDFDTIDSVFDSVDVLSDANVHSAVIDDSYSLEKITFSNEYIEKRNYQIFLAYLARQNRIDKDKVSPIAYQEVLDLHNKINNMLKTKSLPETGMHSGPCIPGQLRLFVDVEGNLYPCERVSESSTTMQIGNLQDGFDYEKARALLNIGQLTEEECRNCWATNHCTICAKYADDGNCLSREKKLSYCSNVREQVLYKLKSMILFHELESL